MASQCHRHRPPGRATIHTLLPFVVHCQAVPALDLHAPGTQAICIHSFISLLFFIINIDIIINIFTTNEEIYVTLGHSAAGHVIWSREVENKNL